MSSQPAVMHPVKALENRVDVFETKVTQMGNSVAIPVTGGLRDQFDPQIKAGNWLLSIALGRGAMLCVEKDKFKGLDPKALMEAMGQVGSKMHTAFMANMDTALSSAKHEIEADPLTAALLNLASVQLTTTSLHELPDFEPSSFSRAVETLRSKSRRKARAS
jgi:hypothetical protein